MKKTLLAFALILSLSCFSQITQTWYVSNVQATDLSPPYNIFNVSPAISSYLTFNDDFTFTAQGACNTMTGSWHYAFGESIVISNYTITGATCASQSQTNFEDAFFGFIMINQLQFYISTDNNNLMLTTPLMGMAQFRNTPLNSSSFDWKEIKVFPNPANAIISIDSGNIVVSKVEFINSIGQSTKTIHTGFNAVDISDLTTGIYIMKISNETGSINMKISKI